MEGCLQVLRKKDQVLRRLGPYPINHLFVCFICYVNKRWPELWGICSSNCKRPFTECTAPCILPHVVGKAGPVNRRLPNGWAKTVAHFLNSSILKGKELPKEPMDVVLLPVVAVYPYLLEDREGDSK